jgi:hypothetical protein
LLPLPASSSATLGQAASFGPADVRSVIRPGAHLVGEMTFDFYDDKLRINFESRAEDPRESWLRLQYAINDYWTGEPYQIDDKIYLAPSRPTFGGLRWWFVCPRLKRRVRKLYLPLGGRHFRSRVAYRLAYASQRETLGDRASLHRLDRADADLRRHENSTILRSVIL